MLAIQYVSELYKSDIKSHAHENKSGLRNPPVVSERGCRFPNELF